MSNLVDEKARNIAITETKKNIIVEAGAGTGKTTLLVSRLLFLVVVKGLKLKKLIALTFTEKAAASLKRKAQENLQKCYLFLVNNPNLLTAKDETIQTYFDSISEEERREYKYFLSLFKESKLEYEELSLRLKTALAEIPQSQMSTLHSFCLNILKRYALEAKLSANIQIDEGGFFNVYFDKKWALFLEDALTDTNPKKDIWLEVLKTISLDDLKTFAKDLCSLKFRNYNPKDNYPLLIKLAEEYKLNGSILLDKYKNSYKNEKPNIIIDLEYTIKCLTQAIKYYKDEDYIIEDYNWKDLKNILQNWDEPDFNDAKKFVKFAQLAEPKKQKMFFLAYSILIDFVNDFVKDKENKNYITFDDIILHTRTLLRDNLAVRYDLKNAYDSIFIDEFQDTDPLLGEIMFFLTEKLDGKATKWQDIDLMQGKLFVVGDPKQSIYRFRGADITAYDTFCEYLLQKGAIKCNLQTNFRSSKEIIDYVNTFGAKQIEQEKGFQPEYVEILPNKELKNSKVEVFAIETTKDDKVKVAEKRSFIAKIIAQWIKDNVNRTTLSNGKILEYKDIAILFRTFTGLESLTAELKELNIPFNIEGSKEFYKEPEILDLINLLKLIKNPQDKFALFGFLRSPVVMLKDGEIAEIFSNNQTNIFEKVENEKLDNIYSKIRSLQQFSKELPPPNLLQKVLDVFDFSVYETIATQSEQSIANIKKFTLIIKEIFDKGFFTLEQILDNLESYQQSNKDESKATLAEENFNTLKLLTIFKSKGLEYPVVIPYDLSYVNTKGCEETSFYAFDGSKRGIKITGEDAPSDPIIADKLNNYKKHKLNEAKRLLYVALTRAKEKLVIIDFMIKAKKVGGYSESLITDLSLGNCFPLENDLEKLPSILRQVKLNFITYTNQPYKRSENNFIEDKKISFDVKSWQDLSKKKSENYKDYIEKKEEEKKHLQKSQSLYFTLEAEQAKKIGVLCHKLLQNIFEGKQNNISVIMQSCGLTNDESIVKEAEEIVNKFIKSKEFMQLKSLELLGVEVPLSILIDGKIENRKIDAIFKENDGSISIIDFKSDKIESVNNKTVKSEHIGQVLFYKQALQKIFNKNIKASLVYIRPAEIYEIKE